MAPESISRRQFVRQSGLALGGVALLAACGGEVAGTTTSLLNRTTSTTGPGATTSAATAPSGEGKTLEMIWDFGYHGPTGAFESWWNEMASRFQERTGAQMAGTMVPYGDLVQRIQATTTARQGADGFAYFPAIHAFAFYVQDVLEPYENWLDPEEISHWRFKGPQFGGQTYFTPIHMTTVVLAANKEILDSAGVDYSSRFDSWDSFADSMAQVAANGDTPFMIGTQDQFGVELFAIPSSIAEFDHRADWGRYITGQLPPDHPAGIKWMDNVGAIVDNGWYNEDASEILLSAAIERFAAGEGAYCTMLPASAKLLDPDKFVALPYWDGPGEAAAQIAGAADGMLMTSFGENKELYAEWVKMIHEPEQMQALDEMVNLDPADDRYTPDLAADAIRAQVYELIDSDPQPHWPTEFMPAEVLFDRVYVHGPSMFLGTPVEEAKSAYVASLEEWREQNPDRVDLVNSLVEASTA